MVERDAMRSLPKLFLLGLVPGLVLLACGKEDVSDEPTSCPCSCRAVDPVPHCVNTQACETTADCPTGTVCGELPSVIEGQPFPEAVGEDPLSACGSGRPSKRCQIPRGPSGRQGLTSGFEVPLFRLVRLGSAGSFAAFTWLPPEETHVVHCALFACPPVVSEELVDGRSVFRIDNYEHCVIAAEVFEPGEGVFDLGDGSLAFSGQESGATCGQASSRVVQELLVGCFAYDKSKIIGATALEPVTPREIFNFHDQFDLACGGEDGRTCMRSETALGVCAGSACRPSCVTKQDCEPYEEWIPGEADGGVEGGGELVELSCVKSGGYVGVCMPSVGTREVGR